MKIGIDARFWNETGVGRYIRNLVNQLQKIDKDNQYVLFVKSKDEQNSKFTLSDTDQISNFKFQNGNWKIIPVDVPWHSIKEQIQFPHILNKEKLDLMHFPYFSVPIFYNRPYIVTIHDLILHHFATGEATTRPKLIYKGKLLGYKKIIETAAQKSKKIIAVSQSTKDEIIDHLKAPPEKVQVIYEGVDIKTISNYKFQISNIKFENYFLHVGNLYPHKNTKMLLAAFEQLKNKNFTAKLLIIGKKDYFQQRFIKEVEEKKLENQVVTLSEVTDEQLSYLYQHALALISSSFMEGFDLPSIEAMANNCLVLASDIPVHREICKHAAIYFESNNTQDLMIKLQQIFKLGKSHYQTNIQEGNELIKQYSWEEMAKQTLDIYNSTLTVHSQ